MPLKDALQSIIHGEVETDDAALTRASSDASIFAVRPQAVVHPMNTQDIQTLMNYATSHKGVSLTVRSAGTDMSGGPLSESIVVDMTSHFTRIGAIREESISVEPGIFKRYL